MKTIFNKFLILFLLFALSFNNVTNVVYAQEKSSPPQETPQPSGASSFNIASQSAQENDTKPFPYFSSPQSFTSAQVKTTAALIGNLTKKNFRSNERIAVVVDNAENSEVRATVYDPDGKETDFEVFTKDDGLRKTVIVKPPVHFRPGKYTIKVTSSDGQSSTLDFTWGVLVINTNKSIYLPNETAKLAMAVLNEKGEVVCDALLRLEIKASDGQASVLSTENGRIKVNPACSKRDVTTEPDYEASYQAGVTGSYRLDLSAKISNGSYSITDSFEVREEVPFDVERVTATRIFPPNQYPVYLNIKANRDFSGTVSETVPGNFAIDKSSSSDSSFASPEVVSATAEQEVLGASTSANLGHPFEGYYPISQEFGEMLRDRLEKNLYAQFNLAGHDGVDFDMSEGTKVLAVDDGKVVMAGGQIYGTTIVIEHSWGRSYYGHLSKVGVTIGDEVKKGDEIGLSGSSGLSTAPHLHFGIKPNNPDMENGYYGKIDPLPFLGIPSSLDPANKLKLISWKINIKKGDEVKLGYFYKAPNISPQFYKLGPLRFYEKGKKVFEEIRQWQIASDAIGVTSKIAFGSTTAGTSFTTASWTPVANTLYLAAVNSRILPNADPACCPTFSGNGMTWVQVNTALRSGGGARITVFRAMNSSPTAGTSTANFGTETESIVFIQIAEFSGTDTSGTDGSGAIVQSNSANGASGAVIVGTLNAFGDATNNVTYVAAGEGKNQLIPPDATYTTISSASLNNGVGGQAEATAWKTGEDTTPGFGTSVQVWELVSAEIKMATSGPATPTNDQLMRHGKWFNAGAEQPFTF